MLINEAINMQAKYKMHTQNIDGWDNLKRSIENSFPLWAPKAPE